MNSGETKCFQELLDEVRELAVSLAVSQVKLQSKNDSELGAEGSDTSDPEQNPEVCARSPVVGIQALARKVLEPPAIKNGWDLAVSQVKLGKMDGSELGSEASDTSDPEQIPEVCERSPVVRNGWDRARKTVHALGAGSADVTARERSLKLRSRMTIVSAFM